MDILTVLCHLVSYNNNSYNPQAIFIKSGMATWTAERFHFSNAHLQ